MARKRNTASDPAPPAPDAEAAPSEPTAPKVIDMPVRDLLQMLGRTPPESAPSQPRAAPALPAGMDAESKLTDLTVGDLLQLLSAF